MRRHHLGAARGDEMSRPRRQSAGRGEVEGRMASDGTGARRPVRPYQSCSRNNAILLYKRRAGAVGDVESAPGTGPMSGVVVTRSGGIAPLREVSCAATSLLSWSGNQVWRVNNREIAPRDAAQGEAQPRHPRPSAARDCRQRRLGRLKAIIRAAAKPMASAAAWRKW